MVDGSDSAVMHYQPNRDYVSNDDVQTPPELARRLVGHFRPTGRVLEPCCGEGNILRHLPRGAAWCEIKRGRDFIAWTEPVDWIVTNPPWSQIRPFLQHALAVADHVVFLLTINHLGRRPGCATSTLLASASARFCSWQCRRSFRRADSSSAPRTCSGWRGRIALSREEPAPAPAAVSDERAESVVGRSRA